jgi:hypothetical protein
MSTCSPEQIAQLQADLASLNAAIASGVRSVTLGGQSTIFNTGDSLIKARNDVQARLNACLAAQSGKGSSKQAYAYYAGRGYD